MTPLPFLYIANWKMNKTLDQGMHYFYNNREKLGSMALDKAIEIIFAPSFPSLAPLWPLARASSIHLAAQDCSEYESGPYNGQVDALSLAQIGIRYGIIGHSDQRNYARETDVRWPTRLSACLKLAYGRLFVWAKRMSSIKMKKANR